MKMWVMKNEGNKLGKYKFNFMCPYFLTTHFLRVKGIIDFRRRG